ncbi:ATP-binding cassette domain-containing protein [Naumannella halotolerans]|uniref:ATP-binding cassette domain-containing protein n=1 Tax=Naumannella halotolerans TaxID=993414 RepID=UPI00370D8D9D
MNWSRRADGSRSDRELTEELLGGPDRPAAPAAGPATPEHAAPEHALAGADPYDDGPLNPARRVSTEPEGEGDDRSARPVVEVSDWTMTVKKQPVFGGVDLVVGEGGMGLIRGPGGSGKTALLLSLAGRMQVSDGTGQVCGDDLRKHPGRVRKHVALANVGGITDLEDNFTVAQHIAERLIMVQPWYKPPFVSRKSVRAAAERIRHAFTEAGELLDARPDEARLDSDDARRADFLSDLEEQTFVGDLSPLQQFFLQIGLAMLEAAPVLAVDNLDLLRQGVDRERAWAGLCLVQRLRDERRDRGPLTLLVTCEDDSELGSTLTALGPELAATEIERVTL